MSPKQRERAEKLTAEKKRREVEERARTFVAIKPSDPNDFGMPSNDQIGFIMSEADERWLFGGNRACKTESAVEDCHMFVTGVHPVRSLHRMPPVKIRMCAPKWRDNVVGVLLEKWKEVAIRQQLKGGTWARAWSVMDHKLFFKNGSWIQFKSGEEDLDTFGGTDLDAVYHDEHLSKEIFDENQARLTDRKGYFVGSMTPEKGITWEEDQVTSPPDDISLEYWFFDMRGNPHLDPDGVRQAMAKYRGTLLFASKVEGQFVPHTGVVIPQYNHRIHVVPDYAIPKSWPRVFCIDTHKRTPSAAMWGAWKPGGILVIYRTAKKFMTPVEWLKYIRVASAGERISIWLLDQPSEGDGKDMLEQESIFNQFSNPTTEPALGLPFQLVKKDTPDFFDSGIYLLWDMFRADALTGKSRIQIFASCDYPTEHIRGKPCGSLPWELKRYAFKKEQAADEEQLREKVRGVNNHYVDDLRYLSMVGPFEVVKNQVKSALEGSW